MPADDRQALGGHSTSASERAEGLIHALKITVGPHFTEKSERIVHRFVDDLMSPADVEQLRTEHGSMNRAIDHLEEIGMKREAENRALTEEVERLREAITTHRDAIRGAGEVRVVDTASAIAAAAKHSIDLDLWAVVAGQENRHS